MDRRDTDRHPTRTVVYLSLPGGGRKACRAVNLSASGVFLSGAGLGLSKGQRVDLAFAVDFGTVTRLHHRQAVVAHVSDGGTGLMMDALAVP
ncbi:MAG: hypothetical protein RLZZ200_154 [Pseudomonadota bacterium]|jgi:hypothetical protein